MALPKMLNVTLFCISIGFLLLAFGIWMIYPVQVLACKAKDLLNNKLNKCVVPKFASIETKAISDTLDVINNNLK